MNSFLGWSLTNPHDSLRDTNLRNLLVCSLQEIIMLIVYYYFPRLVGSYAGGVDLYHFRALSKFEIFNKHHTIVVFGGVSGPRYGTLHV
jgi:hypothetical protein